MIVMIFSPKSIMHKILFHFPGTFNNYNTVFSDVTCYEIKSMSLQNVKILPPSGSNKCKIKHL